ncbi:unnamed protein product [Urochloa decumbens]|uniref:F-box domain-containing protein n=1 Tax=Urochloa decumbens TaxID=240449 RepID=A0ABC9F2H8_9POAL
MEPCNKRIHGGNISGDDRLSALPDDLLHTILSSLKAHQVVQTSVLSRRWRSLWRSVPCLDIDQVDFESSQSESLTPQQKLDKFKAFAYFLLSHRDAGSALDTFQLRVDETDPLHIHAGRWVRRALSCCSSLRVLRVRGYGLSLLHAPLDLGPCLTRLHLSYMSLDERFQELISSVCVVLEDLKLKRCDLCFDSITSASLENLIVQTRKPDYGQLSITAPRLTSLRLLITNSSFEFSVDEMLSLVKASIRYRSLDLDATCEDTQRKLLSNVHSVTSLELSGFLQMMVPDMEPAEFPIFENLRNLLLDGCDLRDDFQLLRHFLHKSPNLEKLTVRCCRLPEGSAGKEGMAKLKKLKSTEIIYKDYHNIRGLVCFLLEISVCVPKNSITLTKV